MLRALAVLLLLVPQDPDPRSLALLDAVERAHRELGDPADVRFAAAKLGNDRARILEAVKALGWEPYAGVLRDAAGTLAAGSGNSIDRALLLRALLEAGGEKTQLVRGELAPAEGAKLLAAWRARAAAPAVAVRPADLGLDPAAFEAHAAARKAERDGLVEEILDAARPEAARLGVLLGAREARPIEAPKEHLWVQVMERGKWIDLDPSPVAVAAAAPKPVAVKDLAPLRRSLLFRLLLDRKSGGKAETVKLLETPFEASSVLVKGVDFLLGPDAKERPAAEKLEAADPKAKLAMLKAVKVWRAGLVADGKQYGARPFDLQGNVYEVDAGGVAGAAGAIGKAAGGLFGRAFGGEEAPSFTFERLSLELAIREPGAPERVHRRVLLAAGEPWLPVARISFLINGAPPAPGEAGRRTIAALARNAPAFRKALRGDVKGAQPDPRSDPPGRLLRFAELRRLVFDRLAEGGAWSQDRVGVVAETTRLLEAEGAGRVRRSIDVFENPVRFAGPEGAARARAAGVADTALEAALMSRSAPGETAPTAWARFERARLTGAKEELVEEGGRLLVRSSPDAWWEIDPATGGCVGRVAGGGGQAALEYAWETGGQICTAADLVSLWGLVPDGPEAANDAASAYGTFCSLFSGTTVRDKMMDKIQQMTKDMWNQAIDALAGGPG
jgi:hypothetical protein